jgi:hypothetical protein
LGIDRKELGEVLDEAREESFSGFRVQDLEFGV